MELALVIFLTVVKILLGAFGYSPKMKSNDQLIKSIVRLKRQLEREPIGEGEEEEEEEEKPSGNLRLSNALSHSCFLPPHLLSVHTVFILSAFNQTSNLM